MQGLLGNADSRIHVKSVNMLGLVDGVAASIFWVLGNIYLKD